jgi:beta-glucanase (GH16 family)
MTNLNITANKTLSRWQALRFLILSLLFTVIGSAQLFAQCEKIKWQDEFDGPNLDLSKWEYEVGGGGWGTGQLDYATSRPENVRIENGKLVLEIRKEDYLGSQYTSGRLRTYKKADFQYGRIEARVKGVYSQGNGFAFWLLGSDYETIWWPKCGEVDIFENTGKVPSKNIGTAHYEESYGHAFSQGSYTLANGARYADAFHTTAIEWSPTYVKWYMDGNLYHTLDLTQPINGYRPFNRPFFIILSVGMGGDYSGPPDATTVSPMRAEIEYVRVYEGTYSTYISGSNLVYQGTQGKQYSVNVAATGNTFNWTVPAGATIAAGQGTNTILVNWAGTAAGGDVKVAVTSSCGTNNYTLNVKTQAPFVTDKMFDDFETATPNFTYAAMSGTLTRQVANPGTNSVNNTPKVGKYVRNAAQQYDYITIQNVKAQPVGEFVYGKRKVVMDVYTDAPVGTKVSLNFENSKVANGTNYPSGRYAIFDAVTTKQNQWETIEFNYTSSPDIYGSAAEVDQWIVLFAPVTSSSSTFYVDNIRTGQSGGTPPTVYTDVLQNYDGNDQLTKDFSNGPYSVVVNPSKVAPNTSNNAAKYVRDAASSYDALVFKTTAILDAYGFKNSTKKIMMDIYTDAPIGTRLSLNFEVSSTSLPDNWPAGRHSNYEAITTKQNAWETVTFYISSTPDKGASDGAVDKFVFLFNPVTNTANTYYIDNIRIASTTPRETYVQANVWEDYDANHFLSSVNSVTGTYTPSIANPFPANGNTTKVAKYVRSAAQQWDLLIFNRGTAVVNGVALKNRTQKLAVDVYTDAPAGTAITIGLDASSIATADNYPTGRHSNYQGITRAQNTWHTVYFSFAAAPDPGTPDNLIDHIAFLFDPGHLTGHTYHFDNVRTLNVVVDQQPLASIVVSPATTTAEVGGTVQFTAQGKDASGNNVSITPTWSVTGGGTINASGLFTASTTGGPFTVKVTSGSIVGNATVTVTTANNTNLALNKPAFASSGNPALAVDGNSTGTRWESTFSDPQWIYVDLQATYNITKVILKWETASAQSYKIQTSSDATTWADIYTSTTGPGGNETLTVTGAGRYIRMYGTVRNTGWGYSLWEYEIYGSPTTTPVLTTVAVTPATATVNVGATQQFSAQGKDQFGNNIAATFTWTTTGGGTISTGGLFSATTAGGPFTMKAASGSISGTATVTVASTGTNIALNKPSFASTGTASLGNDGDGNNTRWESTAADPQWMYIDLQGTYNINKVILKWETASAKNYNIQTSNDATNWANIYTTTTGPGGTETLNITGTGRYIRMYGTIRNTGWGYSLWEFEVYGTPSTTNTPPIANAGADKNITLPTNSIVINGTASDPGGSIASYAWTRISGPNTPTLTNANTANLTASGLIAGTYVFRLTTTDNGGLTGSDDVNVVVNAATTTNLALNKPTIVSSIENAGTPGSGAVDGNATTTRWSSAYSDPQWIYVDLGTSYNVTRVKITWEGAYGKDYQIQSATAAAGPWTTMKSVTGNTALVNDQTGLTGSGRYIRIYGTARGTGYGYSIYELEVYGTPAARAPMDDEMEDNSETKVIISPNPATNSMNISGVVSFPATITVYSVTNEVYKKRFTETDELTIDVENLPKGLYFIRIKTDRSEVIEKVLKN